MRSAAQWILFHAILEIPLDITSFATGQVLRRAHTHPQNVCALRIDLLNSGGVCTGWMKVFFFCVCECVCASVCVCVCIGCGAGVHLLSPISY